MWSRLAGSARLVLHTEPGAPDRGGACDRPLDALGRGADDPLRLDFASAIGVGWPDIELVRRDATERIDKLGRCEEQSAEPAYLHNDGSGARIVDTIWDCSPKSGERTTGRPTHAQFVFCHGKA